MANSSAKRIVIQNNKKIKILLAVIIIAHVIFLGLTVFKPLLQARSITAAQAQNAGDDDDIAPDVPRILFLDENVSKKVKFGYISNSISILFCFWRLYSMSRPVYSPSDPSEIQDPGMDLSIPGAIHQYYFDIIYVSIFVMIMTVTVSSKFWYAHLLTAFFAVYKVWTSVIKPVMNLFGSAGADGAEGEEDNGEYGKDLAGPKKGKKDGEDKENDGLNRAQRRKKAREERKKKK